MALFSFITVAWKPIAPAFHPLRDLCIAFVASVSGHALSRVYNLESLDMYSHAVHMYSHVVHMYPPWCDEAGEFRELLGFQEQNAPRAEIF
jgi:hypothetical protein